MKYKAQVTKSKKRRRSAGAGSSAKGRTKKRKSLSLSASAEESKRPVSIREVMEFYKPIKKPVTLRLDADVLAWFRRDGRLYQTRINATLRRVMEREMRE